ncbi:MAG: helix-turn-helix domain-containing protein [Betaproteobacteria bacterium]
MKASNMPATQVQFDLPAIQSSWIAFESIVPLRPIHNKAGYVQMVALKIALLNVTGDDEDHALSGLLELVGEVLTRYQREYCASKPASPKEALRFLIEARGLNQVDLSVIVAQSNLSAILAGKRKISATLAGKLGKFFGVSPALFVPG